MCNEINWTCEDAEADLHPYDPKENVIRVVGFRRFDNYKAGMYMPYPKGKRDRAIEVAKKELMRRYFDPSWRPMNSRGGV